MIRGAGAEGQNRTDDTRLFRAVLYRLSYLGADVAESRLSLPALSHPAVARIPMACRGRNRTRPCDVSVNSRPPAAPHSVRNEPAIGGSARPRPPTSDSVGTELQEERAEPDGRSLVDSLENEPAPGQRLRRGPPDASIPAAPSGPRCSRGRGCARRWADGCPIATLPAPRTT